MDEPTSNGHRRPQWFLPALLTGSFGLLGVVGGGIVTYEVQTSLTDRELEAADKRDRTIARGAVRLMSLEFERDAQAMQAAIANGYPRAHTSLATALSSEDRRIVASELPVEVWRTVAKAETQLHRAQRLLDRHPGDRLHPNDARNAPVYRTLFKAASAALSRHAVR